MTREFVKCGFLMLDDDACFEIMCDSNTGTCFYEDTTQGGFFEILGVEVTSPGTNESLENMMEQVFKKDIPNIFGLIATTDPFTYYVIYDSADVALISKATLTDDLLSVKTLEDERTADLHAEFDPEIELDPYIVSQVNAALAHAESEPDKEIDSYISTRPKPSPLYAALGLSPEAPQHEEELHQGPEHIKCGILILNDDCFDVLCNSNTGTCLYTDTTQGGTYAILGLEVTSPGMHESLEKTMEQVFKKDIPSIFGLIATTDPFTYYAIYDSAGTSVVSKATLTDDLLDIKTLEPAREVDLNAESDLSTESASWTTTACSDNPNGFFARLSSFIEARDEETLRTYLFRVMVLYGVSRDKALETSQCSDCYSNVSTAELAKRIDKPGLVVDAVRGAFVLSNTLSPVYLECVKDGGLYRLAGC